MPRYTTVSLSVGSACKMIDEKELYLKVIKTLLEMFNTHSHVIITDSPWQIRKFFDKYGLEDNKRLIVIEPVTDPSFFYKNVDFVMRLSRN